MSVKIIVIYYHTGLKKKLVDSAKQKDCGLIGEWQRSIVNHLYWSAASSTEGDSDMIKTKWLSLDNHVHDVHEGHGDIFSRCAHEKLSGSET